MGMYLKKSESKCFQSRINISNLYSIYHYFFISYENTYHRNNLDTLKVSQMLISIFDKWWTNSVWSTLIDVNHFKNWLHNSFLVKDFNGSLKMLCMWESKNFYLNLNFCFKTLGLRFQIKSIWIQRWKQ